MKIPSFTSPKGGRRACLCKDKNTYSIECCDGSLHAQGIGSIYRTDSFLLKEDRDLILQENNSKIIL